jgi:hypothetical protein
LVLATHFAKVTGDYWRTKVSPWTRVTFLDAWPLGAYANYDLQTVWVQADLDGDFQVDGTDLGTVADNLGMTSPAWADGDLNGDGAVDTADLDLAFAQFGLELAVVS